MGIFFKLFNLKLNRKSGVNVVDEAGVQLLVRVGGWVVGGWLDKTKVILDSTQFKFKLKLELSLVII